MSLIIIAYYIIVVIQHYLGYGTAYRLTKQNGDNGVSLFGWILVVQLASLIPGLGFYLHNKYKEENN